VRLFPYYKLYYSLRRDTVTRGGGFAVKAGLALPPEAVYQRQGMIRQGFP
jgi:hypothetical protein